METLRLILNVVFLVALSLLLCGTPVQATMLHIPTTYHHDGLVFQSPLSIQNPKKLKTTITRMQFGRQKITTVLVTNNREVTMQPTPPIETKKLVLSTPTSHPVQEIPTITPTPPQASIIPTVAQVTQGSGGLSSDRLFDMSNAYRASKGLPAFQKDEKSCQLASSRAPEIAAEVSGGHMHSGLRARNLPYWNSENIISMRNEEDAFNWWVNDTIHREAIEGNFTYSCVACSGNSCAQEFTNYQPK